MAHNNDDRSLQRLNIYFHAKAAEVALFLFGRTKDVSWAKDAYKYYIESAEISLKTEPIHASYSYRSAALAAAEIFKATGTIEWAQNAIRANITFLSGYKSRSPDTHATKRSVEAEILSLQRAIGQ